jgi:predicted RNA-binding Zn-ribbon protein involved in translation (DUF1610 family)
MQNTVSFQCPNCDEQYKVVRVEAPTANDKQLLCLSCGAPLHNRVGKYALKYFSTDGSPVKQRNGRQPKLI